MSYDLMVFDAEAAPKAAAEFIAWYSNVTEWGEGHDYNDPTNTSPALRAWYKDMIGSFPAMNGPDQTDDFDSVYVTGYSCSKRAIYADFRWDVAEVAHNMVRQLAEKHQIGFFDASGEGDVFGPLPTGYGRWFRAGAT